MEVVELNHPLVSHKLTILRDKQTGTKEFREIIGELSMMLCYEAMKDAELDEKEIETPICKMKGKTLNEDKYAFVPILRAGTGMLDGLIKVMPNAKIGHIGMYRNEETLKPVRYYYKTPKDLDKREVIVLDPMLATGGSAIQAVNKLKKAGYQVQFDSSVVTVLLSKRLNVTQEIKKIKSFSWIFHLLFHMFFGNHIFHLIPPTYICRYSNWHMSLRQEWLNQTKF